MLLSDLTSHTYYSNEDGTFVYFIERFTTRAQDVLAVVYMYDFKDSRWYASVDYNCGPDFNFNIDVFNTKVDITSYGIPRCAADPEAIEFAPPEKKTIPGNVRSAICVKCGRTNVPVALLTSMAFWCPICEIE